ncbi:hypothetical protein HDU89_000088 [Geranomyces variabilis]|nr:hypothetical protein HDU89_000088 [Geranomyces variabilis]
MSVLVTWRGHRFDIPFSRQIQQAYDNGDDSPDGWAKLVTLGELVEKCSHGSKIPPEYIKLLHGGGAPFCEEMETLGGTWWDSTLRSWGTWVQGMRSLTGDERLRGSIALMKDLKAPLSSYGIKSGSKIMMLGSLPPVPPPAPASQPSSRQATPEDTSEDGLCRTIETHLTQVREIALPLAAEYLDEAARYLESDPAGPSPPKQLRDMHAKAAEVLLQRLLKLDGVVCQPEFDRARAKRKEAVKFIQGELDRLDAMKGKVNAASTKSSSKG